MASGRGKGVSDEELKAVEYELLRDKNVEENEKRMALVRQSSAAVREDVEASKTQKKKRKAPSQLKLETRAVF